MTATTREVPIHSENAELDLVLIRRAADGDQTGFTELYERHHGAVFRTACRILRDRGAAEEVTHEVFLQAWNQLRRYDPSRASVAGWFLMIGRARALDRFRILRRWLPLDGLESAGPAMIPTPEADCDEVDQRGALRHMLNALPRAARQPLELALINGLTHSDIARELGLPLGTVKSRLRTAIRHLRCNLSDPRRLSDAAAKYADVPHADAFVRRDATAVAGTSPGPQLPAGVDVLIADDDADTRLILAAILSGAGAVVRTSASAAEAVTLAMERWPDVVVSDIAMPGGDGYQLIADLRRLMPDTGRPLTAAAFTASASDHEARRVLAAGYDRHLAKPVHPSALVDTVRSLWSDGA